MTNGAVPAAGDPSGPGLPSAVVRSPPPPTWTWTAVPWSTGGGAAEQLYDELFARTWALHSVAPAATADPATVEGREVLAGAARRLVRRIEVGGADEAAQLCRVLWPSGAPTASEDPWWCTPLGRLLAVPHAPPAGDVLPH